MRYVGYVGLFLVVSLVVSIAAGKCLKHLNQSYEREVLRHPERTEQLRAMRFKQFDHWEN